MFSGILPATATTSAASGAAAMKKETGLNEDDFLKLFVAQLQNQDPLNPQDSSQFIAQLAQVTQVEQSYNTNTNLTNLLSAVQDAATLQLPALIGKSVRTAGNQVSLASGGQATLNFNLPSPANSLTVTISDASGRGVRTLVQGSTPAGDGAVIWDGKDDSGAALPSGVYTFIVTGTSASGSAFSGTPFMLSKVDGVSYGSDGTPLLTSGNQQIDPANVVAVTGGS